MPAHETTDTLEAALAGDPRVAALLKANSQSHITWDRFLAMPLPEDTPPTVAWRNLKVLNRAMGIHFPIPDLFGNEYWYFRTHEIADIEALIQCACASDSRLARTLEMTRSRSVVVKSRIDETLAGAQLDGLSVSLDDTREMIQLERVPRTANERLIRNTLDTMKDLERYVDEPFSGELFLHLRELLLDGVASNELRHARPRLGVITEEFADADVASHSEMQMQHIADYLNHLTGEIHDHAVVRALLTPDLFRAYRPLPDVNSQVGRLVFMLYTMKRGMPVLGLVSISKQKLLWEDGLLDRHAAIPPNIFFDDASRRGSDLTGWTTLSLQLARLALQELVDDIRKMEERDNGVRALLQSDIEINHRQRTVLGRALRNPDAEFRIAYHKTRHNVAYATARADLLDLAERGYLEMHYDGRAMTFRGRPGLSQFIEQGHQPE